MNNPRSDAAKRMLASYDEEEEGEEGPTIQDALEEIDIDPEKIMDEKHPQPEYDEEGREI